MPKRLTIFLILIGLFFSLESRAAFSDGDLVKGSGPEVYAIEHGAKRWIPNPDVFQKLFYDWKKILLVGDSVLSGIPPGNKLENGNNYPDGALIRKAMIMAVILFSGPDKAPQFLRELRRWEKISVLINAPVI